uniref:RING-type domain-containing protein n=1 Tax=Anopheles dirus TaxID=7168 RepID=A0A182N4X2_9DIPT
MDIICTICWESLEDGSIMATSCGHIFHSQCIVNWTNRSYHCPECRHDPTLPLRVINLTLQVPKGTPKEEEMDSVQKAHISGKYGTRQ